MAPRATPKPTLRLASAMAGLGIVVACSGDGGPPRENPGASSAGGVGSGAGGALSGADSGTPGSGEAGAAGTGDMSDAGAFWADFAAALCQRYLHCQQDEDPYGARTRLRAMTTDLAKCAGLALQKMMSRSRVQALSRAVAAGHLRIQQQEVAGCLRAAALCEYPSEVDPTPGDVRLEDVIPCREVFEGTLPIGADCDLSEQCAGASVCLTDELSACSGTCTALISEGDECAVDRQCAAAGDAWPLCTSDRCQTIEIGTPAAEGTSCLTSSTYPLCDSDLWCPRGTCVPLLAIGEACDRDAPLLYQCLDGYCDDTSNTCAAYVVHTTAGEQCDNAQLPFATSLCDAFSSLVCVDGRCVATDRSPGSPCTTGYWYDAALCPPADLLAEGEQCSSGDDCVSGFCRGTCVATLCGTD
jgi:hypothetical protein